MEDKKNAMKLDEEQLEQVAGGSGNRPYTDCTVYQVLLHIKNEYDLATFKSQLRVYLNRDCPNSKDAFYCGNCPARNEWPFL